MLMRWCIRQGAFRDKVRVRVHGKDEQSAGLSDVHKKRARLLIERSIKPGLPMYLSTPVYKAVNIHKILSL
ncbi:hypothetical protein NSND_62009 [Nitrospira sp. ND1]|jgi:hypothetical protein|nr:hypothetical protein NSND_62009 [Nitrospira sp. ND1]